MTIPIKSKRFNEYPHLCICWICDCNRTDQCLSKDCNCCIKLDEQGADYHE
jgi:hypothetical protein